MSIKEIQYDASLLRKFPGTPCNTDYEGPDCPALLKRDGKVLHRFRSANDALVWLQKNAPYSWDHAFKHEGYSLEVGGVVTHGKGAANATFTYTSDGKPVQVLHSSPWVGRPGEESGFVLLFWPRKKEYSTHGHMEGKPSAFFSGNYFTTYEDAAKDYEKRSGEKFPASMFRKR